MAQSAHRDGSHDPRRGAEQTRDRQPLDEAALPEILGGIPADDFLVTAAHDGRRSGVIVRWIQRCGLEPPMICMTMRKGHPIEPLIRDSRAFAICQLSPADTLARRLFLNDHPFGDDPFLSLPVRCAPSGSPLPLRARSYLDCDLVRHFDIECDFEIYVGLIRNAGLLAVCDRRSGRGPQERANKSA